MTPHHVTEMYSRSEPRKLNCFFFTVTLQIKSMLKRSLRPRQIPLCTMQNEIYEVTVLICNGIFLEYFTNNFIFAAWSILLWYQYSIVEIYQKCVGLFSLKIHFCALLNYCQLLASSRICKVALFINEYLKVAHSRSLLFSQSLWKIVTFMQINLMQTFSLPI